MAKYKYDVYEITDEYKAFDVGDYKVRAVLVTNNRIMARQLDKSKGTFFVINISPDEADGFFYKIDEDYYRMNSSVKYYGGSLSTNGAQMVKVEVRKIKVKNFIKTIVAEENEYPKDGIKDGKWYVRKEIIQEHKISLKDSEGELINISSIYFKDNKSNILNIAKAYSDKKLVWEKSNSK